MANEIQTKKVTMSAVLASKGIEELGKNLALLPEQQMKARSTALALSSNDNLKDCDPYSLAKFCFETAKFNFNRDDMIYPVPFKNKMGVKVVQAQLSYRGYRELCLRSNKYKDIQCSIVYDCDKVVRNRETGAIQVEFNEDYKASLNASEIGYYAYAIGINGDLVSSVFMSKEEIEKHRKRYSKYGNLWDSDFSKMAVKTVIKKLCGNLSTTPDLDLARKVDQIVYGRENEKDEYLDNPLNDKKKSSVSNNIMEEEITEFDLTEDGEVAVE